MNRDEFESRWLELREKIQEKWGKLTRDDMAQIDGKWEQCLDCLQKRYGYTKKQAEREMKNWQHRSKKGNKGESRSWGEKKVCDELAYEDNNPVYPLNEGVKAPKTSNNVNKERSSGEKPKGQWFGKSNDWKLIEKKKKNKVQDRNNKKRKAS